MEDDMYFVFDSLAAAVVLRPEIVTSEVKRALAVEYKGELTQGVTVVLQEIRTSEVRRTGWPTQRTAGDQRWRSPARIVTDLNGTAIFELYREMLAGS